MVVGLRGRRGMVGLGAAAGVALGDPPADYASIPAVGLFVALMCVCIIVGHLLEENRWMNESTTALFIVSRAELGGTAAPS